MVSNEDGTSRSKEGSHMDRPLLVCGQHNRLVTRAPKKDA